MKINSFSLSADVGLTLMSWLVGASDQDADIVAWSTNKGLFGNVVSFTVSDIRFSKRQTDSYYGRPVELDDVFAARVKTTKADALCSALAGVEAY